MDVDVVEPKRDPWSTLRLAMGWTVLVLWAGSIIVNAIPAWHAATSLDTSLTPLMTLLAGALFAPDVIASARGRKEERDEKRRNGD